MLSKNDTKRITQLYQKKFRYKEGAFIAETPKVVEEFLKAGFHRRYWIATDEYRKPDGVSGEPERVSDKVLKSISRLDNPTRVLAVFSIPKTEHTDPEGAVLALDGVRDPGNMGTIVRLADWFGVEHVLLSEDCVDVWNPKVVQATMGSLARVHPVVTDLGKAIPAFVEKGGKVYVADMDGTPHYSSVWAKDSMILMGNEGVGPAEELIRQASEVIAIPRAPGAGAESLNVAMATGILLAELRRPK